eukprot:CAMPEP_0167790300 /NCGR_PEP_ID=MMETSP0111_2-20121227/11227_1 /TAXON_ID=91324 /ORGANISM="Lotharella globosa, Strain CCCM811" /LENGTH=121 /DNA_ID=CAMNT_0007682689 /DNA_START=236 /DNA_END=601 /DNA_ORIENTATION=+
MRRRAEETPEEGESEGASAQEKNRFSMAGVRQLISMGLGTMAGDIKEINLNDPKRTVVLELEANNFEDAEGNPLSGKYRDKGWVDESGDEAPLINKIAIVLLSVISLGIVTFSLVALSKQG